MRNLILAALFGLAFTQQAAADLRSRVGR